MSGAAKLGALVACALFLLAPTPGAQAAFPGENGKIAFAFKDGDIWTINPDGTGLNQPDQLT